jgi:drug/metabolite transporter (DMT)-like permease
MNGGNQRRGMLEMTGAMTLAGSSVVVGKLLSVRIPVFLSAELSLLAALAAILPLQIAHRRELGQLRLRDLGVMSLQALFGIVLFRAFTLYGLRFTSAAQAGLVTSTAPALMAVMAALILKERLGARGAVAVSLSVAGLLLVNLPALLSAGESLSLTGNLFVLCATACEALLTIFRKLSGGNVGAVTNTTVLAAMSAVMLLPFSLVELRGFSLSSIDAVGWAAVIYYGAFATVIAYILWGHGALLMPANRTGIATAAMPVSALALSALVLGEKPGPAALVGCVAVMAGIVIGCYSRPRPAIVTGKHEGPLPAARALRGVGEHDRLA